MTRLATCLIFGLSLLEHIAFHYRVSYTEVVILFLRHFIVENL